MSISEELPIKITSQTAQDISDEILGGTIKFCRETGYKQNMIMFTFFWTAFLYNSLEELVGEKLVEDIKTSYISSLSIVFPKLKEKEELRNYIAEIQNNYWNNFSRDFDNFGEGNQLATFFEIANKVNSKDDIAASYVIKGATKELFIKIANTIKENINRILRGVDNELMVEYKGVLNEFNSNNAPKTQNIQLNNSQSANSIKKRSPLKGILIFVAIILLLCIIGNNDNKNKTNLKPVTEPISGAILTGFEYTQESEITISASKIESCVVKIKDKSGTTRLTFYVRAGETVTVGVPSENLYVYFASGKTWYGLANLFGEETSYSMNDDIQDFSKYTWEYTLYPVTNGNFTQTPIDADEF